MELLIISILLALCILVISRYCGNEVEKCSNWKDRLRLLFILTIVWVIDAGLIWLVIYLINLRK